MRKLFFSVLIVCALNLLQAQEQTDDGYQFITIKELPITAIQNQSRSSTCWCFSGLSFIESELIRMGKGSHNLSEMYIVWHTYQSKADKYVRLKGNTKFGGGGAFQDVVYVIKHWGIVPEEVMMGLNYGEKTHVHAELNAVLKAYVGALLDNPNKKLSTAWKRGFEGILDAYLGHRPQQFNYQGKEYTPMGFAASLGINPDDYILLTSYTHHPFYTTFSLEISDNWLWADYYNVPLDEFMQVFDYAVNNGYTIAWGSDVTEPGFTQKGVAVVPQEEITQEMRQEGFDNKETTDDHGMHIFGIAKDQNGKKFYMVKNSWGESRGYKGIWYASEAYVAYKTMNIMVHKEAIPPTIKQKLNIK